MRLLNTVFMTAMMMSPALPVWADGSERALQKAQASRVMFQEGVALRDPLMVLAAAKLRKSLNLERTDRAPDGGSSDADANPLSTPDMLETAREFAAGDDMFLGLIEDVAAETTKGVSGGPVYNIATLGAKKTDTYGAVPFNAGDYAEIYVEAKDSSDVNLSIRDSQGRLVCSDTDVSAIAYCGWKPRADGTFSIIVQNMAARTVQYSLITN